MNRWTIESLSSFIDSDYMVDGDKSVSINNVSPIDRGTSSDLSFCSSEDYQGIMSILKSNCGIILCKKSIRGFVCSDLKNCDLHLGAVDNGTSIGNHIDNSINSAYGVIGGGSYHNNSNSNNSNSSINNKNNNNNENIYAIQKTKRKQLFIFVDNPRLSFIKIAKNIKKIKRITRGTSPRAFVSDSAKIGKDCYIGDFTIIGDDCVIGDNTIVQSRASLQNCQIGNNCTIQSGTVIGEDGFAFERETSTLNLEGFPHYGIVIIKDNVEIFANCSIARGSIVDTIIQSGSKIDALCHVAHNVCIGKNTELTAGTIIGGSTTIGDNCWLGLNCTIKNKITVGNKVIVGSGSSVIHDVLDEDIVAGNPAKSIKSKVTADKDKLFLMAGQQCTLGNKTL